MLLDRPITSSQRSIAAESASVMSLAALAHRSPDEPLALISAALMFVKRLTRSLGNANTASAGAFSPHVILCTTGTKHGESTCVCCHRGSIRRVGYNLRDSSLAPTMPSTHRSASPMLSTRKQAEWCELNRALSYKDRFDLRMDANSSCRSTLSLGLVSSMQPEGHL